MPPDPVERRLAAILNADVVGYSRLMAEDEAETIRTVTAYRNEVTALVGEHRGRVVDAPGDEVLAEFPAARDAVEAGVEIQRVIQARNTSLPPDRRMQFRIGIHLGDVTMDGDRVYGDGVNIAARLQTLAEPGGICISAEVQGQVRAKLDLDLEDLGSQTLKNIPEPVRLYRVHVERVPEAPRSEPRRTRWLLGAVALLLLLGVGGWALWNFQEADPRAPQIDLATVPGFAGEPAIAVLPFDNLSGDPEQEYFVDGMAEDLITRLSSSQFSLQVIARNSSFVYKGRAVDVKQVSRELGVRYVVEGSARKIGDRVRISAQLIDATTGHHVWSSTYDRELRDVFALQDEITETIAASIRPEVLAFERERVMRREPQSLDAYESALRGWWHFFKFTRDDNTRARSFFERAAELDPNYAVPFAGIASTHYTDIRFGWSDSPTRSTAEIERAAQRCVALDPREAICAAVVGFVHAVAGQLDEAIAAFERAIQLNPSLAAAHYFLGSSLAIAGRPDEAITSIETAIRLSPHDPMMPVYLGAMALAHFAAERYEDAVDWTKRSVRASGGPLVREAGGGPLYWPLLASSYAHLGRLDDARASLEQLARHEPDYSVADAEQTFAAAVPSLVERYLDGLRKAGLKEE